jgi:hypothetical protein
MWQNIQVDMVPKGHWSRQNISSFWKQFKSLSRLPTDAETSSYNDSAEKNELVVDNVTDSETERTAAKMSDLVGLLSSLPTEELFVFNANDFPLNFNIIAEEQAADSQVQQEWKLMSSKSNLRKPLGRATFPGAVEPTSVCHRVSQAKRTSKARPLLGRHMYQISLSRLFHFSLLVRRVIICTKGTYVFVCKNSDASD